MNNYTLLFFYLKYVSYICIMNEFQLNQIIKGIDACTTMDQLNTYFDFIKKQINQASVYTDDIIYLYRALQEVIIKTKLLQK